MVRLVEASGIEKALAVARNVNLLERFSRCVALAEPAPYISLVRHRDSTIG